MGRRFFVLRAGTSTLQYFKSERRFWGKKPAGELNCDGGEVKRETAGGNVFSISTAERVLTLRAESQQDVTDWTLAVVAAAPHRARAFSAAGLQRDMTMSQVAAAEASKASPRGAPLGGGARRGVAGAAERVAGGAAARRRRRRAVSADDVALPAMEGYRRSRAAGRRRASRRRAR